MTRSALNIRRWPKSAAWTITQGIHTNGSRVTMRLGGPRQNARSGPGEGPEQESPAKEAPAKESLADIRATAQEQAKEQEPSHGLPEAAKQQDMSMER